MDPLDRSLDTLVMVWILLIGPWTPFLRCWILLIGPWIYGKVLDPLDWALDTLVKVLDTFDWSLDTLGKVLDPLDWALDRCAEIFTIHFLS